MIIKHAWGANLIKPYVFQVTNDQIWIWKVDTSTTLS